MAFTKDKDNPGLLSKVLGGLLALLIITIQSFSISKATELSLSLDTSRISFLWYLVGFMLCTPMALTQKGNQNEYSGVLIFASYVMFFIGVFSSWDNHELIIEIASRLKVK